MRFGIDYRSAVLSPAGIGRYTTNLASAMAPLLAADEELVLYACFWRRFRAERAALQAPRSPRVRLVSRRVSGKAVKWLAAVSPISVETFTGPLDVFHYTDYVDPPVRRARRVVTIHDVSFLVSDAWHTPRATTLLRRLTERMVRSAALVLTESQASAADIRRFYGLGDDCLRFIPLGVDVAYFAAPPAGAVEAYRASRGLPPRFFLSVGTLEPRKNLPRTIRALAIARERGVDWPLVVAGKTGWMFEPIFEAARDAGFGERDVRFLGYVGETDLVFLYRAAAALVYPSLYEGFGLPPLEAMAAGCPVIASNRASLPEVIGDAGIQVDPESVEAIADALVRMANDSGLREDLARRGRTRAEIFPWSRCADATLEAYRDVARRL
ncbi:MAG: glycosyltransferase family 4 protein [Planctomycetes bacterium]|nr:glycosyltransferase family 4 protein [Planctomycetota bacterium]